MAQLSDFAQHIPEYVYHLAAKFWPGPLTMVLSKTNLVGDWITGNHDSVGIRMPSHPLALALIRAVGQPLAAPSANRFGKISPTSAAHVIKEFDGQVTVLDGGDCQVGIESTIIDATSPDEVILLRPGHISKAALQKVLGETPLRDRNAQSKQVSGTLKHHYAPNKPCVLFKDSNELTQVLNHFDHSVAVLSLNPIANMVWNEVLSSFPKQYAQLLYHALRCADDSEAKAIAIECPPQQAEWFAIWDRLNRATARSQNINPSDLSAMVI
jgi:L-threonylcarbamoyladenylate synthase